VSSTTDAWLGYERLKAHAYRHRITFLTDHPEPASDLLLPVHLVASLLKRWLLGTDQGAVSPAHLDYYHYEFTFRFNRRRSPSSGKTVLPPRSASRRRRPDAVSLAVKGVRRRRARKRRTRHHN
jgi:hypothetical protein